MHFILKLGKTVLDIPKTYVSSLMRPSVEQPISKDKNVMARTRKYYEETWLPRENHGPVQCCKTTQWQTS
jgi:hypothetical protein